MIMEALIKKKADAQRLLEEEERKKAEAAKKKKEFKLTDKNQADGSVNVINVGEEVLDQEVIDEGNRVIKQLNGMKFTDADFDT